MIETKRYFSCHNHTMYSNLHIIDSFNRPEQRLDYAWDLGRGGIAFTDHDCLSGSIKFIEAYEKKLTTEWNKKYGDTKPRPDFQSASDDLDFSMAIGNEIYVSEEGTTSANCKGHHFWHYILIAKDLEGHRQLREISSAAWQRGWAVGNLMRRTPTYPSDLAKIVKGGHLICSTACLAGRTAFLVKQRRGADEAMVKELATKLDRHLFAMEHIFGKGNYFIELQPNGDLNGDQTYYNKYRLEHYWDKYPFIFTTDAHYLNKDLQKVHACFLRTRAGNFSEETESFYNYTYRMSADEAKSLRPYVTDKQFNEMVANTRIIKSRCKYYTLAQKQVIARVNYEHQNAEYEQGLQAFKAEVPFTKEECPNLWYYRETSDPADHYLMELIAHGYGLHRKSNWDFKVYAKRLEEELWTIKTVGEKIGQHRSDYFITRAKMIEIMWNDAGSIVGPARGSAGVRLINYLLGITEMNPVEMDLPYVWRFRHPSRPDLPDIDVDTESDKRARVFNEVQKYFRSRGGDVLNICTFGTEKTKGAIKTAGRGLGIDDDSIEYITSLIPNERGFDWTFHDCYYGNNAERKPIEAFVQAVDQHKGLKEVAESLEGIVTHLGVHASGVVCLNNDFTNYGAYRKTRNGQIVSAYDLHDQEKCGLVKYDFLTVSALDRIHQCRNYRLEDGTIQWQGSLKKTFDHYLAPEVLDFDNQKRWDMVAAGRISSLFQFDTNRGKQGIECVHPRSLQELAITNALRRLRPQDKAELPMKKYANFKAVPQLWYNERQCAGLNSDEIHILEKYLKSRCGVADTQEIIRQLSMDPHISNFSMKEANKLRKTIAKKNFRDIEGVKALFYQKGAEAGTRKERLDYVWNVQISRSLGYSFSAIHTTGYSIIALQEMNLAFHYPIIYWNTACLSVDASAIDEGDFYKLIERGIIKAPISLDADGDGNDVDDDDNDVAVSKSKNKIDYAKIATALDNFKHICKINLPDINNSRLSFTPNVKENTILYGLKGISKITGPVIADIMAKRPFASFDDFLKRRTKRILTKDKVINLIKCGAFDRIEGKSTEEILRRYIGQECCNSKTKMTMQSIQFIIDKGLLADEAQRNKEIAEACDAYRITREFRKNRDPQKLWYRGKALDMSRAGATSKWMEIIKKSGVPVQTITVEGEVRNAVDSDQWDAFYEPYKTTLGNYIKANAEPLLAQLNKQSFDAEWAKYASGDELTWELDSLNFFFTGHPLERGSIEQDLTEAPYNIQVDKLDDIIEGRQDGELNFKDKIIPIRHLYTIIGTVIDKNNVKGLVTIQCPDGVVSLKLYKDLFATYIASVTRSDGAQQVGFLEKGTHLLVTGIKRGPNFIPKVYKSTGRKSIEKINIYNNHLVSLEEKWNALETGKNGQD